MKRLFRYELAIIAIVCILSIFLFPVAAGPYSAVHGPVTALLAVRAAMKLRWAMSFAALGLACFAAAMNLPSFSKSDLPTMYSPCPLGDVLFLRC